MSEIKALTSLRGLAATYVVVLHASNEMAKHAGRGFPSLAPRGHLAVDLFFVLSGFVMALTYAPGFRARGLKEYPRFLGKRAMRLMPLNVAVALIVTICGPLLGAFPASAGLTACHVLMLQSFGACPNVNSPTWSVGVEWVAYLLFPALLASVASGGRLLSGACLGAAAAGMLALALRSGHGLSTDSFGLGVLWDILRCVGGFTLGLGAYRVYASGRLSGLLASDGFIAGLAAVVAAIVLLHLGDLFAALLFPCAIVAAATNRGWPARVLAWRPLHFLGVISYSIYMIHMPILLLESALLFRLESNRIPFAQGAAFVVAGVASVIPLAWISYGLFEMRLRALVRRLVFRPAVALPQGG